MTCVVCTAALTGRQLRYCSPLCAARALNAARKADGRLAEYYRRDDVMQRNRERLRVAAAQRSYRETFHCVRCQAERSRRRGDPTRFCPACATQPSRRIMAARRLARAAVGTTGGKRRWVQGGCIRCGTYFCAPVSPGYVARHCSSTCRQRDRDEVRRARKAGVIITRVRRLALLERDTWTCYLCTFPIDQTVTAPHPESAVLDHVIPLAAGGPHSEDNLRAAHWMCNALKGAHPLASVV